MDDDVPQAEPPQSWIEALDRADADILAGRVVEGGVIHKMLDDAIERLSHRRVRKKSKAANSL
jgi:hypothetical protein